jgi:hypothetical protein
LIARGSGLCRQSRHSPLPLAFHFVVRFSLAERKTNHKKKQSTALKGSYVDLNYPTLELALNLSCAAMAPRDTADGSTFQQYRLTAD